MNQVERWFGLLTDKLIRRGVHTSVQALENDIRDWIATWNDNPRPFSWTKTADEILNSLAAYLAMRCPEAPDSPSIRMGVWKGEVICPVRRRASHRNSRMKP